ncbi:DsrE family protein [Alloalcanivorax xenomutans]|jgi:sulfur relay (sulfurtransferase) DsrF/TusC family protein|uniref:DsrE family protein n=1 Tax=Alloalcanivorax xenomutans TaxID=1094342 RepID=UPI00047895F2
MKVLQVIDQAFRTTVEEQDDTILWLTQSMRGAGGDLQVLLSGHGVHYAVLNQRQPPLILGTWKQSQPAELVRDLTNLTESGVPVYAVREDLEERGLAGLPLQAGVELVSRAGLADLYERVDQIWQW